MTIIEGRGPQPAIDRRRDKFYVLTERQKNYKRKTFLKRLFPYPLPKFDDEKYAQAITLHVPPEDPRSEWSKSHRYAVEKRKEAGIRTLQQKKRAENIERFVTAIRDAGTADRRELYKVLCSYMEESTIGVYITELVKSGRIIRIKYNRYRVAEEKTS